MRITTRHPASCYGLPVILDETGAVMEYGPGIKAVLGVLGWTQGRFAEAAGKSLPTAKKYCQGAMVPGAEALNVLADALAEMEGDD